MKNISIITLNQTGFETSKKITRDLLKINPEFSINVYSKSGEYLQNACNTKTEKIDDVIENIWKTSDATIWITATGIAIRKIAPFLESKTKDPAVIIVNLDYTQIIPLLSGHIGGANELCEALTKVNPDLTPFVTTATDTMKLFAFDTFAKKMNWQIVNISALAAVSNALVDNRPINIITYPKIYEFLNKNGLQKSKVNFFNIEEMIVDIDQNIPGVIISPFVDNAIFERFPDALRLIIKPVSIGMGLNRGTSCEELENDLHNFLQENNLCLFDISSISSFEAKNDEEGLLELAQKLDIGLKFYNKDDINNLEEEFSASKATKFFNIKGVAEPSAVLAAPFKTLIIRKKISKNTTIAAAI